MATRSFLPGDPYRLEFTVKSSTGALVAADATPTGAIYRNGVLDTAVTPTVAALSPTGCYTLTATIPATYALEDFVSVLVQATVGGVATGEYLDLIRLGSVAYDSGATIAGGNATSFTASGGGLHAGSGGYLGMALLFQGGVNQGEKRAITGHSLAGGVHTFTFTAGFTNAPGTDPFVIG